MMSGPPPPARDLKRQSASATESVAKIKKPPRALERESEVKSSELWGELHLLLFFFFSENGRYFTEVFNLHTERHELCFSSSLAA